MNDISDVMNKVLSKCDILFEGNVFSKESLINSYADFISQTIDKDKHNVGIVYHTGSICFDAFIITYAAISNLIANQTSAGDIVDSLIKEDRVVYGEKKKERYVFKGIIDGKEIQKEKAGKKYVKLSQDNGNILNVPEERWRLIEPYFGNAVTTDGRGIRKKGSQRDDFYTEVLEMPASNIASVIDTSTVLIMSPQMSDRLIKGLSIKFGKVEAKLLDLVTASYYTEEEERSYSGNTGKNEPVLKVCSKVSVARKLIYSRNGNRHIGLVVMGHDMINSGETELPELVNRKSLQYVFLCSEYETDYINTLLEDNDEVAVFACTKDFLIENTSDSVNVSNGLTEELNRRINTIKEKENESIILDNSVLSYDTVNIFKKTLLNMKRETYESEDKDMFIIQAYSLFNLLTTCPFSVKELDECALNNIIMVASVGNKYAELQKLKDSMNGSLKEKAEIVLDILNRLINEHYESTPKEKWLKKYIIQNTKKKIAVVLSKAYFVTIINAIKGFIPSYAKNVIFTTPGKFDNTRIYDEVIVLGDYEGKRFNTFSCNVSSKVVSLLYKPEEAVYNFKKYYAAKKAIKWNNRSTIKIHNSVKEEIYEDKIAEEMIEYETELSSFVSQVDLAIDTGKFNNISQAGRNNITTDIVAVVTFTDDSKAFFSKNYKAYVYNVENGIVKEEKVNELAEGDSIVFTKNNNETKDIVDSILGQMISDGRIEGELKLSYERSKKWKKDLVEFMDSNGYSPKEVVDKMVALDVPVVNATIIGWLDEDSHTVGPRNVESLKAIGKLTGNNDLYNNPDIYVESCRSIRRLRRSILDEIGRAIMNKLRGISISKDNEFYEVYEKIDSLAKVLEIERIVPTETVLPSGVANRPIKM